jgi:hypothetical protein
MRLGARCNVARGRGQLGVAGDVAGGGGELRQHAPVRQRQLTLRERFFHQLQAIVQVVADRARHRLGQRDRLRHRFLIAKHRGAILVDLRRLFVACHRLRLNDAAAQCDSDRCANQRDTYSANGRALEFDRLAIGRRVVHCGSTHRCEFLLLLDVFELRGTLAMAGKLFGQ